MTIVDRSDPRTWPTYTADDRARVIALADEMGEAGIGRRRIDGADWDDILGRMETELCLTLPSDWTDPLMAAIKRAYRKAHREANG